MHTYIYIQVFANRFVHARAGEMLDHARFDRTLQMAEHLLDRLPSWCKAVIDWGL